jgi:hypothetical protein
MKDLIECKAMFIDVHQHYLQRHDDETRKRFEFCADLLCFIYGDDFKTIKEHWIKESLNDFFSDL